MPAKGVIRVEIDGRPPPMEPLQRLALDYGGHFTAMQVRDARARPRAAPGPSRRGAGFDDALFTGHDGAVSETSIANIGFLLGDELVWPSAPALQGITMQLLEPRLATAGIPTRRGPVHVAATSWPSSNAWTPRCRGTRSDGPAASQQAPHVDSCAGGLEGAGG